MSGKMKHGDGRRYVPTQAEIWRETPKMAPGSGLFEKKGLLFNFGKKTP
jgi:hypothetical protein